MKKSLLILTVLFASLLCATAGALPAITDGESTGWIAENNYLFLQIPGGKTAQLSMPIDDLIRFTEDELICLSGDHRIIAVKKDGSGSRVVDEADMNMLTEQPLKEDETGALLLNGNLISASASAAVTDGIYVYTVEKDGTSYVLRVSAAQNDGKLIMLQDRDANALALSNTIVTEPLSLTVTKEALTLTGTDHAITVMNLITGQIFRYSATGLQTASACVQGNMLYRYQLTDDQRWTLESGTAITTPTPTTAITPTPAPSSNSQSYSDDDGTIYYGAYGKTVRKIQTRLSELGYPIWKIDGKYGEETQLAINLFCDAIHVREHKYITLKVQRKLFAKDAPFYDPYLPLKKGDQGISVLYMQSRLKELGYDPGKLDGIYGKNTVAAVARFQADYGIQLKKKEKPGEEASHEMLELLYAPEPEPDPLTPTPTPQVKPASPTDL